MLEIILEKLEKGGMKVADIFIFRSYIVDYRKIRLGNTHTIAIFFRLTIFACAKGDGEPEIDQKRRCHMIACGIVTPGYGAWF
jgi:hypothetical protein